MENDRRHTAIHEAGHAVIGRLLKMLCGGASIIPNDDLGSAGNATIEPADVIAHQWELRGKFREYPRSAMRGRILTAMAGREAEAAILGDVLGCDEADLETIEAMAEDVVDDLDRRPVVEARLRRFARQLVCRHRQDIERIAAALEERHALTGEEIDAMMPPGFMARPVTWALALAEDA